MRNTASTPITIGMTMAKTTPGKRLYRETHARVSQSDGEGMQSPGNPGKLFIDQRIQRRGVAIVGENGGAAPSAQPEQKA